MKQHVSRTKGQTNYLLIIILYLGIYCASNMEYLLGAPAQIALESRFQIVPAATLLHSPWAPKDFDIDHLGQN